MTTEIAGYVALDRKPGRRKDCTVRAAGVTIFGGDYDRAERELAARGREHNRGFWIRDHLDTFEGVTKTMVTFPSKKGQKRMRLAEFCRIYPGGRWLVWTAKHVSAVVDGVVYDAVKNPRRLMYDRCVYRACRIERGLAGPA